MEYRALQQMNPLSDWPHGYCSWLVDGMLIHDQAQRERQQKEAERAIEEAKKLGKNAGSGKR